MLAAADAYGISDIFLPTIFIDLPEGGLEIANIDEECSPFSCHQNYCKRDDSCEGCPYRIDKEPTGARLDTAILQPRVTISTNLPSFHTCDEEYDQRPIHNNTGVPIDLKALHATGVVNADWAQSVIDTYGDTFYNNFIKFANDFALADLHDANIGWLTTPKGDMPVILDWLSHRGSASIEHYA